VTAKGWHHLLLRLLHPLQRRHLRYRNWKLMRSGWQQFHLVADSTADFVMPAVPVKWPLAEDCYSRPIPVDLLLDKPNWNNLSPMARNGVLDLRRSRNGLPP